MDVRSSDDYQKAKAHAETVCDNLRTNENATTKCTRNHATGDWHTVAPMWSAGMAASETSVRAPADQDTHV